MKREFLAAVAVAHFAGHCFCGKFASDDTISRTLTHWDTTGSGRGMSRVPPQVRIAGRPARVLRKGAPGNREGTPPCPS